MDIRVFKCEYCGKDYGQGKFAQQGLRRHIQTNHLRKFFFIHKNFSSSRNEILEIYMYVCILYFLETRVFTCENCGKIFRYKKGLKRHQEVIHEGLRPYKCETCGKDFGEKRQYQQHVLQVINQSYLPQCSDDSKTKYLENMFYNNIFKINFFRFMKE